MCNVICAVVLRASRFMPITDRGVYFVSAMMSRKETVGTLCTKSCTYGSAELTQMHTYYYLSMIVLYAGAYPGFL